MNIKALLHKPDFGLLLLRMGLGAMMMSHGIPKFVAGASSMESIGKAMAVLGITAFPLFWGFMAALSELVGGFFILIGYKMRFASMFLAFVMFVSILNKINAGSAFIAYAWPTELFIVFSAMIFIGSGRFSVDKA